MGKGLVRLSTLLRLGYSTVQDIVQYSFSNRTVQQPVKQEIQYNSQYNQCSQLKVPQRVQPGQIASLQATAELLRGGGPLVISHKCRLISWLFLAPTPSMHFLHKTFPGASDKISHCAKFHGSSCLISRLPKSGLCETTERSPPLLHY